MTIPLGRKLTLNKHFPCTLSDSCFLSSAVSLIYSFHLPSLSPSLVSVSHFCLSHYYLHSFSSLFFFLDAASFHLFSYSILSFFYFFLILLFCYFYLLLLLSHSIHSPQPAPREVHKNNIQGISIATEPLEEPDSLFRNPASPIEPPVRHVILQASNFSSHSHKGIRTKTSTLWH